MLINTEKNKLIRENWKEWFRVEVSKDVYSYEGFRLPKGFVKVYSRLNKDIDVYWFIIFVPFVKLWRLVKKLWWKPAIWLYKKVYFEYQADAENIVEELNEDVIERKNITKEEAQEAWERCKDNEFVLIYYPDFEAYWAECGRINNLPDNEWYKLVKEQQEKVVKIAKEIKKVRENN